MAEPRWHVLVHQIPPRPLYLRAKVRQRLAKVGALALKNSVYVLPATEACLEDFQWIAQEARAGKGEAWVLTASFAGGAAHGDLVRRFRAERDADYGALASAVAEAVAALRHRGGGRAPEAEIAVRVERLKERFAEIDAVDFFKAPGRRDAAAALSRLERALRPRRRAEAPKAGPHADLVGKTWVTRRGVQVDRIGSAWLVRRFVDPGARFRFADPKALAAAEGEIRFDTMPGDVTHDGDRCTFETLVARAGIKDPAVREIAEIVHDIDLKDGKYGRPDAPGIQRLLAGLVLAHPEDDVRLARGFALFDDLYHSFARAAGTAGAPPKSRPGAA